MKIKTIFDMSNVAELPDLVRFCSQAIKEIVETINGRLDFGNLRTSIVSVTFSGTTSNLAIEHGLGRTPEGYIIVSRSVNITVFDGTSGNTDTVLNLGSSGAGTVSVMAF